MTATIRPRAPVPAARDIAGFVRIRGAREHNLKDVSLETPSEMAMARASLTAPYLKRYLES